MSTREVRPAMWAGQALNEAARRHDDAALHGLEVQNAELTARIAELEARNAALARFSAEAAHELTEPLVIAESSALLVVEELGQRLDPFLRHRLEAISRVSADARLLIEALVQEAGLSERSPEVRRVNLRDVIEDAVALVEHRVKSRDIEVVIGTMPTVTVAPALLSIIVRNLVVNAVKYGPRHKGEILIRAHTTAGGVKLCVTNAGEPIDPTGIERLFRPFERGKERRDVGGFGLGLTISSRIAVGLGGRMGVTPERGGNTFFVFLPDSA